MYSFSRLKVLGHLLNPSSSKIPNLIFVRNYQITGVKDPKLCLETNINPKRNTLYMWGFTAAGALGDIRMKKRKTRALKRPTVKFFPYKEHVLDVACGLGFTIYSIEVFNTYRLFGSGLNTDGQLGHQSVRGINCPLEVIYSTVPIKTPIPLDNKVKIKKIAAGRTHSLVVTNTGEIFAYGNNDFGQCARPILEGEDYMKFRHLKSLRIPCDENDKVIDVIAGMEHSLFLTESGKVYSCGNGSDGQTGLGTYKNTTQPTLVEGDIKGEKIVKISSTTDTVLALNDKGDVFGWGNSEYCQLPLMEPKQQVLFPHHFPRLQKYGKMKDLASSGTVSMALTESGDVFVWGYGILGKGIDVKYSEEPTQIPNTLFGRCMFTPDNTVESLSCGVQTLAAITNSGQLYMWGVNKYGQLGLGHKYMQYYPMMVSISARVIRVSCGMDHTMAICRSF